MATIYEIYSWKEDVSQKELHPKFVLTPTSNTATHEETTFNIISRRACITRTVDLFKSKF